MEQFGTALVPDFSRFYGVRLVVALEEWDPVEVLLHIQGMPGNSLYIGRYTGEKFQPGFTLQDWVALDTRNSVEGLRAITVAQATNGKKKNAYRPWDRYPGHEQEQAAKRRGNLDNLFSLATPAKQR